MQGLLLQNLHGTLGKLPENVPLLYHSANVTRAHQARFIPRAVLTSNHCMMHVLVSQVSYRLTGTKVIKWGSRLTQAVSVG